MSGQVRQFPHLANQRWELLVGLKGEQRMLSSFLLFSGRRDHDNVLLLVSKVSYFLSCFEVYDDTPPPPPPPPPLYNQKCWVYSYELWLFFSGRRYHDNVRLLVSKVSYFYHVLRCMMTPPPSSLQSKMLGFIPINSNMLGLFL